MKSFRSLQSFLKTFGQNTDGFAATEFAMIVPVLVVLYFGVTELSDGLIVDTRVTRIASTAADLVAQDTEITDAEMTNIFNALDTIMFPYGATETSVVISSLVDNGSGNGRVAWSEGHNGTARGTNSIVEVPAGLIASGGSVIYAEVSHDYSSPAGHLIYGTIELTDEFYVRPRRVTVIPRE